MGIAVKYSEHFTSLMETLTEKEQELLGEITLHIESKGLTGLPGRNKSSNNFSENFQGPKRIEIEDFVVKNSLWHYHIGFKKYLKHKDFGDWTSEFVVHYQNLSPKMIRFVHYSSHKPVFRNPLAEHLI